MRFILEEEREKIKKQKAKGKLSARERVQSFIR